MTQNSRPIPRDPVATSFRRRIGGTVMCHPRGRRMAVWPALGWLICVVAFVADGFLLNAGVAG